METSKKVFSRENIRDGAQVAIAVGLVVTILALGFDINATYKQSEALALQKRAMEASLFNQLTKRWNALADRRLNIKDNGELLQWYVSMFNALDDFAMYVNHGYFSSTPAMVNNRASFIVNFCDGAAETQPELVTQLRIPMFSRPGETRGYLSELQLFYKNATGREGELWKLPDGLNLRTE